MRKFLHNKNSKILIITLVILTVMSVFSHNGSNIFSGAVNTVTKGLSTLTAGAASSDKSKEELEKENEQLKKENAELREQLVDYLDAKEENAKLIIDGKEVTNDYEFTADKENMEVQIEFTFDGSTLGGKQFVTFEELYDITNPEEPKKVTEHKEINDEGQTVTIKEVPETPTPETPGTTTKTSNPPKTEDTANAILWIAILVLSAAGITGVRIWNKKKQVKRLGIEEKKEEEE